MTEIQLLASRRIGGPHGDNSWESHNPKPICKANGRFLYSCGIGRGRPEPASIGG
jgi:hypothetical protein